MPLDPFGSSRRRRPSRRICQARLRVTARAVQFLCEPRPPISVGSMHRLDDAVIGRSRHPSVVRATTQAAPIVTIVITMRRWRGSRSGPRSIHGKSARNPAATPGTTMAPITSHLPGKYFSSWKRPRKYHSGLGMYVASRRMRRGRSRGGAPCQANAPSAMMTEDSSSRREPPATERMASTIPCAPGPGPKCPDAASARDAGPREAPAPREKNDVRRVPPRQTSARRSPRTAGSTPAMISPAKGVNFEMFVVTTVAQYARWSHGSRYPVRRKRESQPKEREARQPRHLARRLVRAKCNHAQHVRRHATTRNWRRNNEAAHERSRHPGCDEAHAVVA